MTMLKKYFFITLAFAAIAVSSGSAFAQNNLILKGKVFDGSTMKPVPFAIVIVQEANVFGNAPNGNYALNIPKPGRYTVTVQSQGFQTLTMTMSIQENTTRNFTLNSASSGNKGITIRGARDIQNISRQRMTAKEIKEVPASFGDSVSALTSLPGINRADGGFFGPLVIRGADENFNGYYIDDIPLYKPMHFGGLHSVINSNLMSQIDVYSSAFPSQFGNAQAAIINISTIDDVKESGGYADVGLISADALIKAPITHTIIEDGKAKEEQKGYMIASGRYGYLSLFIPFVYENIMHKKLDYLPQYWDYQIKIKYNFDEHNSLTFLSFGNRDYIDLVIKDSWVDPSADPAMVNFTVYENDQAHSAGLYYTYKYNERFSNTLMTYGAFNRSDLWFNVPNSTADWTKDLGVKATPYIFGIKDKVKLEWWESHAELRAGVEANYYYFETSGKTFLSQKDSVDIDDPNGVVILPLGMTIRNKTLVTYIENKFTFGWLTVVPGVHTEYLALTKKTIVDPRGMASIAFPTGTTLAAAGGYYSSFIQTNPVYFTLIPNAAGFDYLKPQRSIHRSASVEQKIDDITFKVEGFYNNFYDLVIEDNYVVDGETRYARNGWKLKTYGAEFLIRLSDENEQGLFGWISYTYNRSRMITHQIGSSFMYGNVWNNSYSDMPHVAKLIAGYTFGRHTLSGKFQFSSSTPYTKIVGSYEDTDYENTHPGVKRIVPVYGTPNTGRLDPTYRLDIRYSYKTSYKWGYVTWYVEGIGILSSSPQEYKWDYREGFQEGSNPKVKTQKGGLSFLPNFGVETKF
jgi:hypothetical protein